MTVKTLIKILILSIIFYSCDNDESLDITDHIDDKLVEEYTYDPYGVVFKITNDINNAFNYDFDSLAFAKFQYDPVLFTKADLFNIECFTWISFGCHVNWRYNYTGQKQITIVTKINEDTAIVSAALKLYSCDPSEVDEEWFQEIFPYPVNDTVHVSISKLIEDM